jgi:hypothetical protein
MTLHQKGPEAGTRPQDPELQENEENPEQIFRAVPIFRRELIFKLSYRD